MASSEIRNLRQNVRNLTSALWERLPAHEIQDENEKVKGKWAQQYQWHSEVPAPQPTPLDSIAGERLSTNAFLWHQYYVCGRYTMEHVVTLNLNYDPDRTLQPDLEVFGATWMLIRHNHGHIEAVVRGLYNEDVQAATHNYNLHPTFYMDNIYKPVTADYHFAIEQLQIGLESFTSKS